MTKSNLKKVLWVGAFVILAGAALPASANDIVHHTAMHHKAMHHHHHAHHHHHVAPAKHS